MRTESVSVSYGAAAVVVDANIELSPGGVTALIGPNGSGKSTLLRGISRLADSTGTVTLDGVDTAELSPRAFAKRLTVLAQQRPTPGGLTVTEVVELGRHPHRRRFSRVDAGSHRAVERAIALTGLDPLRDRPVTELSGGQLQRVWLATCLAQQTDVLLLDEPTTFLDLKHQMSLLDVIRDLADDHGLTIGVVLHDLEQAADIADQVILVSEGRIVAKGTPAEVMTAERLTKIFGVTIDVASTPSGDMTVRARRSGRRLGHRVEDRVEPVLLSA
ncbi:ABC transporter ATP-binding protein [Nesterenkonia salmonea]|uniref:ABC transporter ATP-binding protein n=1 Tax=Nesterenkonia salmonea TaxID=1804987 RepID=A0A5R9BAW2_9MICC|nr:ABC transporter ATP-binding protein [Nesterenkonia salmonea]